MDGGQAKAYPLPLFDGPGQLGQPLQRHAHPVVSDLEEKIYQLRDTDSYDERQSQLENNIYVLTALIQEYMYNYLYYEAARP